MAPSDVASSSVRNADISRAVFSSLCRRLCSSRKTDSQRIPARLQGSACDYRAHRGLRPSIRSSHCDLRDSLSFVAALRSSSVARIPFALVRTLHARRQAAAPPPIGTVAAARSVASASARRCSSATTRRMSDVDALRSVSSCPLRLTRIRSNAARMQSSSVADTLYLKTWLSLASLTKRACRTFHCPSPSTHTWEIGDTWGDG